MKKSLIFLWVFVLGASESQGIIRHRVTDQAALSSISSGEMRSVFETAKNTGNKDLQFEILTLWKNVLKSQMKLAKEHQEESDIDRINKDFLSIADLFREIDYSETAKTLEDAVNQVSPSSDGVMRIS